MIDPAMREAIWNFFQDGVGINKLSEMTKIDRKTIRRIIALKGDMPILSRKDKINIEKDLLQEVYNRCDGWIQRMHEIFTEEKKVEISYSTLTSLVRELGLGKKGKERSDQKPDIPGEEFQHDTSPYTIKLGDKTHKVQASQIYFRYSKLRYVKFYTSFTKFHFKCFFYEALNYFGYVPSICIVDNTNLVVHHGTGPDAVFHQDMISFAEIYGFTWKAHRIKHSDRKGGVEKGFFNLETNFFAGRTFSSFEDLNKQIKEWCEKRLTKPTTKKKIIPADAFEYEKPYLKKIPFNVFRPYIIHERDVDQYGYVIFGCNYYWTPIGTSGVVKVLEYSDLIVLYHLRKKMLEYALPALGTRDKKFTPEGMNIKYSPKKRTVNTREEEKKLRNLGEKVNEYVTLGTKENNGLQRSYQFIRGLYSLYKKLTPSLFEKTISRALQYKIFDLETLHRISSIILQNENIITPSFEDNDNLLMRDSYIEGQFSPEPDLTKYGKKNERT